MEYKPNTRLVYNILKLFPKKDLVYVRGIINNILSAELTYQEKVKLEWGRKGYNPEILTPPIAPSSGDLKLYKEFLRDKKGGRALLLGSTPSLRNLLNNMGFEHYVVVDFSFTTLISSLYFVKEYEISEDEEVWLKSNWLDMPLASNVFDCIIGDFAFTQIEPAQQKLFTSKLATLLKKDGKFVGRNRVYICGDKKPEEIIDEAVNKKGMKNIPVQRIELLYNLRGALRDKETQITAPEEIIAALLRYETNDENKLNFIRRVVRSALRRIDAGLPLVTQTKEELEGMFTNDFSIETVGYAPDYASQFFPVYVLRKK